MRVFQLYSPGYIHVSPRPFSAKPEIEPTVLEGPAEGIFVLARVETLHTRLVIDITELLLPFDMVIRAVRHRS